MRMLIKNGKLVNPRGKSDGEISIKNGMIEAVGAPFGDYDETIRRRWDDYHAGADRHARASARSGI